MKKIILGLLTAVALANTNVISTTNVYAAGGLVINEVTSNNPDKVEIYNTSGKYINIKGYKISDEKGVKGKNVVTITDNINLQPGEVYVVDARGLGSADTAMLFDRKNNKLDDFKWSSHPSGSYARVPDGSGDFRELSTPTFGKLNSGSNSSTNPTNPLNPKGPSIEVRQLGTSSDVVINEVEGKDDINQREYVEIYNRGSKAIDVSGWYITDNKSRSKGSKTHPIKKGTVIKPGQFIVFESGVDYTFGLGSPDEVRLYDSNDKLIDSIGWVKHAGGTYSRYPDGSATIEDGIQTKGAANKLINEAIERLGKARWPGLQDVTVIDPSSDLFGGLTDLSGLDYHDGWIYGVNNKQGTYTVFKVHGVNNIEFAPGFSPSGKSISFTDGKGDLDSEGITVAADGTVYMAVERDNKSKDSNYNLVIEVQNPLNIGSSSRASRQWDITNKLPKVNANMGIETIEWVSFEALNGKLWDQTKNKALDGNDYPNAVANGVFFVGLENDGKIYSFILNENGRDSVVINTLDRGVSYVMGLNYDTDRDLLWAQADNGANNLLSVIQFNGSQDPKTVNVDRPENMAANLNNEGFVIIPGEGEYLDTYWFKDGTTNQTLRNGKLKNSYASDLGFELAEDLDDVIEAKAGVSKPDGYVKVTFDKGIYGNLSGPEVYYVKSNTEVSVPAPKVAANENYTFDKWSTDPSKINVNKDTTITAIYQANYSKQTIISFDNGSEPSTDKNGLPINRADYSIVAITIDGDTNTYLAKKGISLREIPALPRNISDYRWNPQTPNLSSTVSSDQSFIATSLSANGYELADGELAPEGWHEVQFGYDTDTIIKTDADNLGKRFAVKDGYTLSPNLIPEIVSKSANSDATWYKFDSNVAEGTYKDSSEISREQIQSQPITSDTRFIAHAKKSDNDLVYISVKVARRNSDFIEVMVDREIDQLLVDIDGETMTLNGSNLIPGTYNKVILEGVRLQRGQVVTVSSIRNGINSIEPAQIRVR